MFIITNMYLEVRVIEVLLNSWLPNRRLFAQECVDYFYVFTSWSQTKTGKLRSHSGDVRNKKGGEEMP